MVGSSIIGVVAATVLTAGYATACSLQGGTPHVVTRIEDARTLVADDGTRLHLASILPASRADIAAETKQWPPADTARAALRRLVHNKSIVFVSERAALDRYGRRVGNALVRDAGDMLRERWVQARLVEMGHARVALSPETSSNCASLLLNLEAMASEARRGLWHNPAYRLRNAHEPRRLLRDRSTFQIVTGRVARVDARRGAVYLNFGSDWRRDFTVHLSWRQMRTWGINSAAVQKFTGRNIRIRGWIERRHGPLIRVWRPEQIELLAGDPDRPQRTRPPALLRAPTKSKIH